MSIAQVFNYNVQLRQNRYFLSFDLKKSVNNYMLLLLDRAVAGDSNKEFGLQSNRFL
jgi:hypothetical protein